MKEIADRIIKWTDEDIAELNEFRRMMREEERIAIEKQELAKEQALIEKGKTEGKTEALIERARIALRKNTDLKTISALLGLSMTTLKHLAAEEKLQKPPKRLKK